MFSKRVVFILSFSPCTFIVTKIMRLTRYFRSEDSGGEIDGGESRTRVCCINKEVLVSLDASATSERQ